MAGAPRDATCTAAGGGRPAPRRGVAAPSAARRLPRRPRRRGHNPSPNPNPNPSPNPKSETNPTATPALILTLTQVACAALTRRIDAMLRAPPQRAPPDSPLDASPPDTIAPPPDTIAPPPDTIAPPPDTIAPPPDTIAPPGDGAPLSAVELYHQRVPTRWRWREALLSPAATVAAMVGLGVLTLSPTLSTTLTLTPSPNP
eukprot:scaffold80969_cov80-Phaeocystis_antarctica.AAC.4